MSFRSLFFSNRFSTFFLSLSKVLYYTRWKKKKIKTKVNVEELHINLQTNRDVLYFIKVEGYWIKKNMFRKASSALWEKLTTNQYIKITDDFYLNTNDIAEVHIQARKDFFIEKELYVGQFCIFV